jgi:hypothetical protein
MIPKHCTTYPGQFLPASIGRRVYGVRQPIFVSWFANRSRTGKESLVSSSVRRNISRTGAGEVGLQANGGLGWGQEMPGLGTKVAKLTLKVGLCELGVVQSQSHRQMAK